MVGWCGVLRVRRIRIDSSLKVVTVGRQSQVLNHLYRSERMRRAGKACELLENNSSGCGAKRSYSYIQSERFDRNNEFGLLQFQYTKHYATSTLASV